MSADWQTLSALAAVALAAGLLARGALKKRSQSGCGNEGCGAVSPDAKALRKKLKNG